MTPALSRAAALARRPVAASLLALALMGASALGAVAQTAPASPPVISAPTAPAVLSLSAYGEVKVVPDRASIGVGVQTLAPTAAEAMRLNRERMGKVMAALIRQGVAERDIQTSSIDLSAQYAYAQNEAPKLTGYQAANTVSITVNDVSRLGVVLDTVVGVGVNQLNGISFGLKTPGAAEDTARRAAVKALQAKADLYAAATGNRTVRLVSLSEGGPQMEQPLRPVMAMAKMSQDSSSTPVAAGELSVRVDISGTFALIP